MKRFLMSFSLLCCLIFGCFMFSACDHAKKPENVTITLQNNASEVLSYYIGANRNPESYTVFENTGVMLDLYFNYFYFGNIDIKIDGKPIEVFKDVEDEYHYYSEDFNAKNCNIVINATYEYNPTFLDVNTMTYYFCEGAEFSDNCDSISMKTPKEYYYETINQSEFEIQGFDSSKVGKQNITIITYGQEFVREIEILRKADFLKRLKDLDYYDADLPVDENQKYLTLQGNNNTIYIQNDKWVYFESEDKQIWIDDNGKFYMINKEIENGKTILKSATIQNFDSKTSALLYFNQNFMQGTGLSIRNDPLSTYFQILPAIDNFDIERGQDRNYYKLYNSTQQDKYFYIDAIQEDLEKIVIISENSSIEFQINTSHSFGNLNLKHLPTEDELSELGLSWVIEN